MKYLIWIIVLFVFSSCVYDSECKEIAGKKIGGANGIFDFRF